MDRPRIPVRPLVARRLARGGRRPARRAGWAAGLTALALLLAGASPRPAPAAPLPVTARPAVADAPSEDEDLPVPPIPPDLPPSAQAAPLPDFNSAGPLTTAQTSRPGLRPDVFHAKSYNRGDGYVNGSGGYDEGRFKQGPAGGIRLDVPLQ